MTSHDERRHYTRIEFASKATIAQAGHEVSVNLLDISLNGVLIETPTDYAIDTNQPVAICITLTGEIAITMQTHLAHSSNEVLGFRCDSIDMDSMTHLRRLIELNMSDPNASERVLDELIIKK